MPVALITAADGVCRPTLAALIIGRQRRQGRQDRRSIYPVRFPLGLTRLPHGLLDPAGIPAFTQAGPTS